MARVASGGAEPQGERRFSDPPADANSNSASVGRKPPSHAQNAEAVYQSMQLMGLDSLSPGASVHMTCSRGSHFRAATREDGSEGSGQEGFHPLFAIPGCAPAPAIGLLAGYAATNARN